MLHNIIVKWVMYILNKYDEKNRWNKNKIIIIIVLQIFNYTTWYFKQNCKILLRGVFFFMYKCSHHYNIIKFITFTYV